MELVKTFHKPQAFSWNLRVYYQDTDAGGVVYHSKYLDFMERARTEWLFALDLDPASLIKEHDLLFVVRSIEVDYIRPARLNNKLTVTAQVVHLGICHLLLHQYVMRDEEILVKGKIKLVSVAASRFKPIELPSSVKEKIPVQPALNAAPYP